MSFFQWSDELSVAIPSIDEQHMELVRTLNRLHDGMAGPAPDREVGALLRAFVTFAAFHFAYEERLLSAHGYPGFDAHLAEHHVLLSRLKEVKRRYDAREIVASPELPDFLKEWLLVHIGGTDKAYGGYLAARGVM